MYTDTIGEWFHTKHSLDHWTDAALRCILPDVLTLLESDTPPTVEQLAKLELVKGKKGGVYGCILRGHKASDMWLYIGSAWGSEGMVGRMAGHVAAVQRLMDGTPRRNDRSVMHTLWADGTASTVDHVTLAVIPGHYHLQTQEELRDNAVLAYLVEFVLQVYLGSYHSNKRSAHLRCHSKWGKFEWEGCNARSAIRDGIAGLKAALGIPDAPLPDIYRVQTASQIVAVEKREQELAPFVIARRRLLQHSPEHAAKRNLEWLKYKDTPKGIERRKRMAASGNAIRAAWTPEHRASMNLRIRQNIWKREAVEDSAIKEKRRLHKNAQGAKRMKKKGTR